MAQVQAELKVVMQDAKAKEEAMAKMQKDFEFLVGSLSPIPWSAITELLGK